MNGALWHWPWVNPLPLLAAALEAALHEGDGDMWSDWIDYGGES